MATKPTNTQPQVVPSRDRSSHSPSDSREALQALLAFSTLHEQIRQRRAEDAQRHGASMSATDNPWSTDQFMLDEVLQLVAERAQSITASDGIAIALAEGDEIICRASVGEMAPDRGMRLDPRSGFSGACMRAKRIIRCDDSENDPRVDVVACRRLGTRSMVAVPLMGGDSVVGLLEAFSTESFAFSDDDVRSLSLLAELILAALKPEDEERIVRAAKVAAAEFDADEIEDLRRPLTQAQSALQAELASGPEASSSVAPMADPASPASATAASTASAELPLELSKEDIAPPLFLESTPTKERQKFFVFAALLLMALGGVGLWWKLHPGQTTVASAGRAGTPAAPTTTPKPATLNPSSQEPAQPLPAKPTAVTEDAVAKPSELTSGTPAVTGIRHWVQDGTTTVAIDLQSEVQYETHRLENPDRIYFDLHDTALAPSLTNRSIPIDDSLVSKIRVAQPTDGVTRVVLDTKAVANFSVRMEENPYRLMIEVRTKSEQVAPIPAKQEPASAPQPQKMAPVPDVHPPTPPGAPAAMATTALAKPSAAIPAPGNIPSAKSKTVAATPTSSPAASPSVSPSAAKPSPTTTSSVPTTSAPKAAPSASAPVPTTASSARQPDIRAHASQFRIVIDAGHGGWDLGTVGRHGLLEKDLVLDVAERLGKLIESRLGGEVIFTRRDDNYLSLEQRAELANNAQADFFVSVHANYSDVASARGVETYYSSFFLPPEAREAELRGATQSQPVSQPKLSSAELKEKVEGSRKLAAAVQRALYDSLAANNSGIRNRGVREQSYVVLTGTQMPSILAEISFVSSPADEERLKSEAYREQIAEALYTGIAQYQASRHPMKLASNTNDPTGR